MEGGGIKGGAIGDKNIHHTLYDFMCVSFKAIKAIYLPAVIFAPAYLLCCSNIITKSFSPAQSV